MRMTVAMASMVLAATTMVATAGRAPMFRTTCSSAINLLAPSTYYNIKLVPTKRVPGTGNAKGSARINFTRSPFGVAVSMNGSYKYDLTLVIKGIKSNNKGTLTAWVTSSDLKHVRRLGILDESLQTFGKVEWNKFLVVVTLEPTAEPTDMWKGAIVMRGMSRSGMMHTMAGHGPYEQEPCSTYGF